MTETNHSRAGVVVEIQNKRTPPRDRLLTKRLDDGDDSEHDNNQQNKAYTKAFAAVSTIVGCLKIKL